MTHATDETRGLHDWLEIAVQKGASDLHLVVGHRPTLRLHGRLEELDAPVLSDETVRAELISSCEPSTLETFQRQKNVDFALQREIGGRSQRFRANYFVSGQTIGACFRIIPAEIPDLQWAGFPPELADTLAHFRNGLVLISGVTGAGKTTTLAMIINFLNQEGGYLCRGPDIGSGSGGRRSGRPMPVVTQRPKACLNHEGTETQRPKSS